MREICLIWVEENISHIAKHGVSVKEVEEVVRDRNAIILKQKKRYAVIGSAWGRILFVILEKVNSEYYVVTARDATEREKRRYKVKKK